jgi:hypothetical protein
VVNHMDESLMSINYVKIFRGTACTHRSDRYITSCDSGNIIEHELPVNHLRPNEQETASLDACVRCCKRGCFELRVGNVMVLN